jgi:hypothetical protein
VTNFLSNRISTALATADNAFADNKKKTSYEKSQATYQANDCGNEDNPMFVFCQNLFSQLQGDGNAVNIIGVHLDHDRLKT